MGLNMVQGPSVGGVPVGLVVICLVVGIVIGFVASNSAGQGAVPPTASLSVEDKNFLVQVANSQVDLTTRLTALQSAQLDWCTASGGQWQTAATPAEVNVTSQQAQQLQSQGATVRPQDGNFFASVVVVERGGCIVVPTANQQQGQ